jgi:hypothetical protein
MTKQGLKENFVMVDMGNIMLIGDSSCAIEPFLMRKLQEAQPPVDNLYNESILQTRNVVEDSSLGMRVKLLAIRKYTWFSVLLIHFHYIH